MDLSIPGDSSIRGSSASKGARSRARILEEAIAGFGDAGFRATSVSAIARAAGLTPSAVYAYFPDKEALFAEALDLDVAAWLEPVLATEEPGPAPVLTLLTGLVAGLDRHPLVAWTLRDGDRVHLERLIDGEALARVRAVVEGGIAARLAARDADPAAAPDLAVGVETLVVALLVVMARVGTDLDPARVAGVVALFQAALGGPPDAAEWRTGLAGLREGEPPA